MKQSSQYAVPVAVYSGSADSGSVFTVKHNTVFIFIIDFVYQNIKTNGL
tara:strand:+ start:610 stop:756 length:147 start_codon:yes stop_codon:yes gene_type:complete